jgi:hypothetical protein
MLLLTHPRANTDSTNTIIKNFCILPPHNNNIKEEVIFKSFGYLLLLNNENLLYRRPFTIVKMADIGFTTGSLRRANILFSDMASLYYSFGAEAIELSFGTPTELHNFGLSRQLIDRLEKYNSVSIHAPWKEVKYERSVETNEILEKLKLVCGYVRAKGIVMHPDVICSFSMLEKSGLPILLENMDRRKRFGTHPCHLKHIFNDYNFGLVLDLQHAYEHDPTMAVAKEFIDMFGSRLHHMHVSGNDSSRGHVPVHMAANRDAIERILKLNIGVPKILEGILAENVPETISAELKFVKGYELN